MFGLGDPRSVRFGTQSSCVILVPSSWMVHGACGCHHLVFPSSLGTGRKQEHLGLGFQDKPKGAGGVLSFSAPLGLHNSLPSSKGEEGDFTQHNPSTALITSAMFYSACFHLWPRCCSEIPWWLSKSQYLELTPCLADGSCLGVTWGLAMPLFRVARGRSMKHHLGRCTS